MSNAVRFTAEDLAAVDAALAVLEERFALMEALEREERQRLFKMGSKTEKFCREVLTVLDKNRQLAPPAMDLNGALGALRTIDQLRPRTRRVLALVARMRDTELALGSDVATAARQGYAVMGEYGSRHGLDGMRKTLGARFKRKRQPPTGSGTEGAA